jgi:Terminase large subunit, T4likevirus-type, N-terminal
VTKPLPQTLLRQAAVAMAHALSPSQWAVDCLNWHPDPWQRDLLECNDRQIAVCCSRQSGKSTTTATLAAHVATFQPGSLTLLLSPSQRQASELLTKVRSVLTSPGLSTKLVQDAATSLELVNGSRVVSLPSSPDAIRGYSKPAIIIEDEASWVTDEVHLSLRPMLATSTNGRFLLLSTPAGRSGRPTGPRRCGIRRDALGQWPRFPQLAELFRPHCWHA